MDKPALINKIKALDSLTNAEKSDLIDLLNNTKKYGLIWEDKPEEVERDLLTMLPVLQEVPERRILAKDIVQISLRTEKSKPGDPTLFSLTESAITAKAPSPGGEGAGSEAFNAKAPNHILIEGDNLHALTALSFTHEGKIDVMYFDPPYNTGNKDFKYNDSFVDKEDSYRHSKWLSFMHKRLQLSHRLLSEKGVIFISIDDNEQAQLKLLCDDVFGEGNFVAELPTIMNLKGNQDQYAFAGTHEYSLVYIKSKNSTEFNHFILNEEDSDDWVEDEYGFYKKGANLKSTGVNAPRAKRPNLYFPVFINPINNNFYLTDDNEPIEASHTVLYPITNDSEMSWRWSKNKFINESYNVIIIGENGNYSIYKKQRPSLGDLPSQKPKSLFYKPEYSSGNGTGLIYSILIEKKFNNPKPLELIKDFIHLGSCKLSYIILDIFAGSGTTLHAAMALNEEDGGNRQCILVTNNENNICEEVTYERNKRVIAGYTNAKGVQVPGLTNNNLRYYKTGFVPSAKTEVNRRLLTTASVELLQIKEDCYNDVTTANGFEPAKCCIFTNESGKYFVIIFHSRKQHEVVEQLCGFIQNISDLSEKVRVYAFSPETETLAEDFYPVTDKINAVPLPDAIYNAYRATFKTLKLEKKTFITASPEQVEAGTENPETSSQSDLFEQNAGEQP